MSGVVGALAPIFLLILLGHAIRRLKLLEAGFWEPAERLTYFVLFPALLLENMATAELRGLQVLPMAAALVGGVLVVAGLLVSLRPRLGLNGPAFTSVFQGAIRPNTYVGLAAAAALSSEAGITLAAISVATVTPLVNVLSVAVLARHAGEAEAGIGQTLASIARNPLILAVAGGAALNWTGIGLPPVVDPVIDILGRAALPLGLLAVGAGLDISAAQTAGRTLLPTAGLKLVLLPGLTWLACLAFGVEGVTRTIAVLMSALPTSASSYILARQMGGDHGLLAAIITVTTLLAILTLPAAVILAG
ncbi:MAG: AEC family transporter [Alphaproteobacteria bacterium]